VDSPHGGGKIPLMPNYLVSASDDAVVLRNFEGMLVRYQAEDKPRTSDVTATRGVSELLTGVKTALIPEGTDRMARRKKKQGGSVANGSGHRGCGPTNPERDLEDEAPGSH